ncbi:MAG: chaperone modulator CbpM [Verrucomicrobiota bacterium]
MNEAYTLEVLAKITGIESTTLVQYQERGIIRPEFDDETVRSVRRAEHLREACGMNLEGVKLLTQLLDEVERLREQVRARR